MDNEKIIDIESLGTKDENFKRKLNVIKEIAMGSAIGLLEDKRTHVFAVSVGLYQGLKYKGNFKNGIKGGIAAYSALILANTIHNIVDNRDEIKNS